MYDYYSYYPLFPYDPRFRVFPEVNPNTFMSSAKEMQILMKDAELILSRIQGSRTFAFDLMTAAQNSQKEQVTRLINGLGIKSAIQVDFNPDELKISLYSKEKVCCHVRLALRW